MTGLVRKSLGVGGVVFGLLLIMYFGIRRTPSDQSSINMERALNVSSASDAVLLKEAESRLSKQDASMVQALQLQLNESKDSVGRLEILKQLSGTWYQVGEFAAAGIVAKDIAVQINDAESWSITGTTFVNGVVQSKSDKEKQFCTEQAVQAFQQAISLDPDNVQHRINMAVVYTENPPQDNPMLGIQQLLELNRQEPDDVKVLNTLARLAIKTGQYDRAIERLERSNELEPDNKRTHCLLAVAYAESGNIANAEKFKVLCGN